VTEKKLFKRYSLSFFVDKICNNRWQKRVNCGSCLGCMQAYAAPNWVTSNVHQ